MKDEARRKARERMRAHRTRTDYAYDRARYRALKRLREAHLEEFRRLLYEELLRL